MSNKPEQVSRLRRSLSLTSMRSRIVAGALAVVLIVGGTGALLAKSQASVRGSSGLAAVATATAPATATPLPTATVTAGLRSTATRKAVNVPPSGPLNYLVVQIGGCGSFPYPDLYFTSTDPGKLDALFWNETASSTNQFFLFGDGGAYINFHQTETVQVLPNTSPAQGPLTFTVQADRTLNNVDYGPAGYWHGTVYPCK